MTAWKRSRLWSRILATAPVMTADSHGDHDVEIHLLCWEGDYLAAIWALKTFYHFADPQYPLVLHFNGVMSLTIEFRLRTHFPCARLITQREADGVAEPWLAARGLNALASARRSNPFIMKLADFLILRRARRILILDSDVLFFARPAELIAAAEPCADCIFMANNESIYNIDEAIARERFGLTLPARVNSGIALLPADAIRLDRCEAYLPALTGPTGWMEQTLYAMAAAAAGRVRLLPETYLVSLREGLPCDGLVARHYAGPSRPMFTTEGIPFLLRQDFLRALGRAR